MIIKYGKEYLKELYEEGKCGDRRYRFQPKEYLKELFSIRVDMQKPLGVFFRGGRR